MLLARAFQQCRVSYLSIEKDMNLDGSPDDTTNALQQPLIDISLESWRFAKLFVRLLAKLDAGEAPRYANQHRYFLKRLDEALDATGLRIVNLEGHPFDPGMAASPLNIGDFGPDDPLVVDQMVEPVLMGKDGVVRTGTVMLKLAS